MRKEYFLIFFLLIFVFSIFSFSFDNQFVNWDDNVHLTENVYIQRSDVAGLLFSTVNKIYIPLTSLSFLAEYYFFGNHPLIYHMNNIFLHVFNVFLVLCFFKRMEFSFFVSLVGAFIFAVHPMHVESVCWVTERKDVLYTFFYLASLNFYLVYLQERKKAFFFLTVLFGVLSILSKPMALSLPFILILIDWYKKRGFSYKHLFEKFYFFALFAPVIWVSYIHHMRQPVFIFPDSLWLFINCFSFHIKKFFFMDYYVLIYKIYPQFDAVYTIILSFTLAFLIGGNRLMRFAVLFYFLSVFFLLRMDISADFNLVADRFMYLPSLGFCLLLGTVAEKAYIALRHDKVYRICFYSIIFSISFYMSIKTILQIEVWQDSESLWKNQLRYQKQAATALVYKKLADALMESNDTEKLFYAVGLYEKALQIKPDFSEALEKREQVYHQLLLLK